MAGNLIPSEGHMRDIGSVGSVAVDQYRSIGPEPQPIRSGGGTPIVTRIVAAFRRYKWLIGVVVILGSAASVTATRFIPPKYNATATVYVETSDSRGGPIRSDELLKSNSWIALLRSFAVVDPVVRGNRLFLHTPPADSALFTDFDLADRFGTGSFKLTVDPAGTHYSLESRRGIAAESGQAGDSIGRKFGFRWLPPRAALGAGRTVSFDVASPRDASVDLLGRLRANMPDDKGNFLGLVLAGDDPEQVAKELNGLVEQFVKVAADLKKSRLTELRLDLEGQLAKADSSVRTSEGGLESFRVQTITEPREDVVIAPGLAQTQVTVMGNYLGLRQSLDNIRADRRAIEEVLHESGAQGVVSIDAFHTINAVRNAPELVSILGEVAKAEAELRALRNRYTDDYKGVKDLVAALTAMKSATVPQAANRLVTRLKVQEANIEGQISSQGREMRQIPIRSLTESRLRRDADAAVGLYRNLQGRHEEAKLAELSATPDIRILDRAAVPTKPESDTAPRIIFIGVAASIGLALALALLLDRLDRRFRYPEQASDDLGLTILGVVPVIRRQRQGLMSPGDTAQIVEAFRAIRLNLAHSFGPDEPIILTVSSPSPGDGKSLLSSNLALSFADTGYKTLLIDGDTRRGEMHRTFGLQRQPGLIDYLMGKTSIASVIVPTQHARLSLVSAGERNSHAPEMLGSVRMKELITLARANYQVVIIDSPPFGAGVDPFVLGTMTGNVVVVLRAGETDRRLAEAKLQMLDRLPTRVLGAVLNHIDVEGGTYKYYAYEYYGSEDSGAEEAPAPPAEIAELPRGR